MKFLKIFTVAVVVALLTLFTGNEAKAQLIIGGGLGVNYTKLGGLDNAKWRIGGNARTIIGYRFSPGFALHLEPTTTIKGTKWQFDTESAFFPGVDSLRDVYNRNYSLIYLDVPLLAVISFPLEKEGIIPYDRTREQDAWLDLYLGPTFSYYFFGTAVETAEVYIQDANGDPTTSKSVSEAYIMKPYNQIAPFDFGVTGGIGVRFYLSDRWRFVSDIRYTMGFMSADYGAFRKDNMLFVAGETGTGIKPDQVNATNHVASLNIGFLYEFRGR